MELRQGPHLAIQICVAQHELLALEVAGKATVAPIRAQRPSRLRGQAPLERRQLLEDAGFEVHIRPPCAQELHRLSQPPMVLLHHVRRQDAARPRLPAQRVDQYAFRVVQGLLNKLECLVGDNISLVKDDLAVCVHPIISQVRHANRLPMIGYLLAATIYHSSHLVGNDKLQVLRGQLVTDEQAVLHLDRTENLVACRGPCHVYRAGIG
mmetsp:Transcript_40033/g.121030  ORF Transcript_40033/g.121030 Transcript_40033/m.121030 type:complete len:209 (+) Transcript_40033:631-1257(+)